MHALLLIGRDNELLRESATQQGQLATSDREKSLMA